MDSGDLKGFAVLGRVWLWVLQWNLVLALLSGQLGSAETPAGDSGSLTVRTTVVVEEGLGFCCSERQLRPQIREPIL